MSAPLFDPARILAHQHRAAKRFGDADFLYARAWDQMLDRRADILHDFSRVAVRAPMPPANLTAMLANGDLQAWSSSALAGPQLDLVYSLLELHLAEDPMATLREIRSVLTPDGLLLASLFGEDCLHELRQSLLQAELDLNGGAAARIIPMIEVQTLGGLLQSAGFALPVVDVERVVVRYGRLTSLLHDLRNMAQSLPFAGPVRPLTRRVLARAEAIYRERFGDIDGRLPATFTILHACGWAPHPDQPKPLKPGSGQMFLGDALRSKPQSGD